MSKSSRNRVASLSTSYESINCRTKDCTFKIHKFLTHDYKMFVFHDSVHNHELGSGLNNEEPSKETLIENAETIISEPSTGTSNFR
jgi:hypothetical protein